jgi:hypothetical protein
MPDLDPNAPQTFTADDVAKQIEAARREAIEQARKEERDKLYAQLNKGDERFQQMQAEVERLKQVEADRQKEIEKREREAEKARKAKEEAELSAKELLAQKEQTWQQKLDQLQQEQEAKMAEIAKQQQLQQAMWDKEREMGKLALYIRDRIEAERDNIAPELLDFIDGNTPEEVDASIERVKAKTAAIVEGMRQAQQAARAGMPGTAPSAGATGITPGLDTGTGQTLTAEDIKGMSMADFRALRPKLGMGSASGQGIFG